MTLAPQGVFNPQNKIVTQRLLNLDSVLKELLTVSTPPKLADYVFMPLAPLFKEKLSTSQTETLLSILNTLIVNCWSQPGTMPPELAKQLVFLVVFMLKDSQTSPCHVGITGLKNLISSIRIQKLPIFEKGIFAHTVDLLLDRCMERAELQCHIDCFDGLILLLQTDGDSLSFVLPKTASVIVKVVKSKAHFSLLVKCIQTLTVLVHRVFDDVELFSQTSSPPTFKGTPARNSQWLEPAVKQMALVFKVVGTLQSHHKGNVKESVCELYRNVVRSSCHCLKLCIPFILDGIAHLSATGTDIDFTFVLEDEVAVQLGEKAKEISSLLVSANHEGASINLKKMMFYIDYLRSRNYIAVETLAQDIARRLSNQMSITVIGGTKTKRMISPASPVSLETELILLSQNQSLSKKEFPSFELMDRVLDPSVQRAIVRVLECIGSGPDSLGLIYNLVGGSTDQTAKAISLWAAMCALHNADHDFLVDDTNNEAAHTLLEVAAELMDQTMSQEQDSVIGSIQTICLETISKAAIIMKGDFSPYLIDYLYPVIYSLASSNEIVRATAQQTSLQIAAQCSGGSLRSLIFENCDYLVDAISIRLTSDMVNPRSFGVLLVLIKFGGSDILFLLEDVVNTLFTLLDMYHGYAVLCEGIFAVFNAILDEILSAYMRQPVESGSDKGFGVFGFKSISDIGSLLEKQDSNVFLEDRLDKSESDSDDEDVEIESEEREKWTSPVPHNLYFLVHRIFLYCDTLLTHESTRLRLQILTLLPKCVPILFTSEDNWLPALAASWDSVESSVCENDVRIVVPAARALGCFLEFAGDFLCQRFKAMWSKVSHSKYLQEGKMPHLDFNAYKEIAGMLIVGLNAVGKSVPQSVAYEIVKKTMRANGNMEDYGYYSDVAWMLANVGEAWKVVR